MSWCRDSISEPSYRRQILPISRTSWISFATLPHSYAFEKIYSEFLAKRHDGFLLRGCPSEVALFLAERGCEVAQTGAEAVLQLNEPHLEKPSLQKLLKQVRKHGNAIEIVLNEENRRKLYAFQMTCRHGNKPQLSDLFRTFPYEACRCFAFVSAQGKWLAAMTLSQQTTKKLHTELMLKHRESPVGVMEALIESVFFLLQAEGFLEWSLSEVPFYHVQQRAPQKLSVTEQTVAAAGEIWKSAYNFDGLFRFKDKFAPVWQPIYLCAYPQLSLILLAEIAFRTGYADLILHDAMQKLPRNPLGFLNS
ncbi:phosphatidylglycerol lysyltransferase domain-containing protein [Chloroherpeton thalassium]|uniref:phosphatidylglycerol lysyltransferase domain-containing protein n=1 Tax=Chloroherpeton thalassium TaxID=100716 RepID=UPI0003219CF0|nr:phosphatidylglycerol lysyltransferase domain-containing protein [Chloroherpeton thalassium]